MDHKNWLSFLIEASNLTYHCWIRLDRLLSAKSGGTGKVSSSGSSLTATESRLISGIGDILTNRAVATELKAKINTKSPWCCKIVPCGRWTRTTIRTGPWIHALDFQAVHLRSTDAWWTFLDVATQRDFDRRNVRICGLWLFLKHLLSVLYLYERMCHQIQLKRHLIS